MEEYILDFENEAEAELWPRERQALADFIVKRLALPDWYSDLSMDNANMWDNVVQAFQEEPGDEIGLDFQCSGYESIYWDCAEAAAFRERR